MISKRICVLSFAMCCFVSLIAASGSDSQLPSISELEKVTFTADKTAASRSTPPYTEVSGMKKLFLAYGAEAKVVAHYKDPPIPTRSESDLVSSDFVSPHLACRPLHSVAHLSNKSSHTGARISTMKHDPAR